MVRDGPPAIKIISETRGVIRFHWVSFPRCLRGRVPDEFTGSYEGYYIRGPVVSGWRLASMGYPEVRKARSPGGRNYFFGPGTGKNEDHFVQEWCDGKRLLHRLMSTWRAFSARCHLEERG